MFQHHPRLGGVLLYRDLLHEWSFIGERLRRPVSTQRESTSLWILYGVLFKSTTIIGPSHESLKAKKVRPPTIELRIGTVYLTCLIFAERAQQLNSGDFRMAGQIYVSNGAVKISNGRMSDRTFVSIARILLSSPICIDTWWLRWKWSEH